MRRDLDFELLNSFQRDFPLTSRPFDVLAQRCEVGVAQVLDALERLRIRGAISRVGAVFAPGRIGASTLVALEIPEPALAGIAGRLASIEGINHSYEREHRFNLWAVATAENETALASLLREIEACAGTTLLDLRLAREYRIDLGFDLRAGGRTASAAASRDVRRQCLAGAQRRLVAALQGGIALVAEPFRALAEHAGLSESQVLNELSDWCADGTIRRFGVIVRHHELGYRANAMAVWNVPDAHVDEYGARLAAQAGVTLAYRRRRGSVLWPYNLFCMVHGKERSAVSERLAAIRRATGLAAFTQATLFSRRRFKQTGAHYIAADLVTRHG